jgi:hypothetical protein
MFLIYVWTTTVLISKITGIKWIIIANGILLLILYYLIKNLGLRCLYNQVILEYL